MGPADEACRKAYERSPITYEPPPKCGHVGCEEESSKCPGHICRGFYRSRLSCPDLKDLWTAWLISNPKVALGLLADAGIAWAVEQREEWRQDGMREGSL